MLVLLTRDGTQMYSSTASLLSWLILFLVEVASPVTVSGSLHRVCVGNDMDYAVTCSSGALVIGSSSRLVTVISIQAGVLVAVWTALRLSSRWRYLSTKASEASLLVSGIAEEFMATAPGTTTTQYVIDDVACVLAGLLALRFRGVEYTFDIKLWLLLKDDRSTTDFLKVLPRPVLVDRSIKINPLPRLQRKGSSNLYQRRRRLVMGLQLVSSYLGPFGSIDMVYVPPPTDLQELMSTLLELTRAPLAGNLSAQAAYYNITPLDLSRPAPKAWLSTGVFTYGGSPLCTEFNSGQKTNLGLTSLLSFDAICLVATGVSAKLQPTRQQYVLGSLLANLTSTSSNLTAVCALDPSFTTQCRVYLPTTSAYIRDYMQVPPPLASAMAVMATRVRAMNISLMIYARTSLTAPLELRMTNLLDATESDFSFFGWLFLYDWVFGYREVISFQGDTQTLVLVTDLQTPLSQPTQPWEVPDNIARYLRSGVLYVTGVMIAIASLAFVYIIVTRGQFEGWNMLELGRVGGIVWVGRPFLLLRSMTAILVLSTATVQLRYSGYSSYLVTVQDPWYKTLLAANEVTWLITIVNDIFLIVTGAYTAYYITPNGFVVWTFSGVLTLAAPVAPVSSIALTCHLSQVDADALCTAGTIHIGSFQRMLLLAVAVLVSQIVSFAIARRWLRDEPSSALTSLFLSSGAKYLFVPNMWLRENLYYVDRASAVLDGLVTLRYSDSRLIVLDIKTWRIFAIPLDLMPQTTKPDFMAAVPLLNDN
ncbi:hypothetical protein SDRG_15423 [Saprolegnia diclina VS20]|uniref:Transmembrane protein n=1 Tax=Saprolegnia diclina (strain VS20) TaxID=1156394 RepID=T0R404_SAPDV|nr:hypothetical protein SDRG_15423 [Saprolegnia diclina VS20]EQC26773.1 hypothetical protein SDRG_15423 [Saprolegnia diclina VS20]|eukprot:XP_008619816.1 hypothetical protein SDRG_15423 [Saprolegnia diclina VS20]